MFLLLVLLRFLIFFLAPAPGSCSWLLASTPGSCSWLLAPVLGSWRFYSWLLLLAPVLGSWLLLLAPAPGSCSWLLLLAPVLGSWLLLMAPAPGSCFFSWLLLLFLTPALTLQQTLVLLAYMSLKLAKHIINLCIQYIQGHDLNIFKFVNNVLLSSDKIVSDLCMLPQVQICLISIF
jgi:hypothetical protein